MERLISFFKRTATQLNGTQCCICCNEYNFLERAPRVLNECLHTYCQKCLEDIISKPSGANIKCPMWKKEYSASKKAEEYPKNLTIIDMLQVVENTVSLVEEPSTVDEDWLQIFIRNLSGNDILIRVKPTDQITKIKELVTERTGVSKITQRLIYSGKELKDDMTIATAKIKAGSVIHLAHRLKGALKLSVGLDINH